uniref:MCM_N domain-containing protein n=1 Tax=Macrostomum lignano TaxID=282301 RepID=A0A1I8HWC2_9PLAT
MAHAQFAQVNRHNLQVQETSKRASVANDPIARLMYYLKCVENVDCGDFPSYMTDYANYRRLSQNQRNSIIATASRNEPDDVLLFVEVDELPDNDANKFLQLSAQEESLTAFGIRGGGQAMMGLRRQLGNKQKLIDIMVHTD